MIKNKNNFFSFYIYSFFIYSYYISSMYPTFTSTSTLLLCKALPHFCAKLYPTFVHTPVIPTGLEANKKKLIKDNFPLPASILFFITSFFLTASFFLDILPLFDCSYTIAVNSSISLVTFFIYIWFISNLYFNIS